MKAINRRRFLKIASASSVVVAAGTTASVPALTSASRLSENSKQGTYTFRAVAGLPSKPMPAYASYVIEGQVNLTTRTGVLTRTLFAGSPDMKSTIALPGLSRIVRIHDVQDLGGKFRLKGVIDDRSLLQQGESPDFELLIDPARKGAQTNYLGTDIIMQLKG